MFITFKINGFNRLVPPADETSQIHIGNYRNAVYSHVGSAYVNV